MPQGWNMENKNCGNDIGQAIQFLQINKSQGNIKEKVREPAGYRESLIVMCWPNMDPSSKKNLWKKIDNWKFEQSDYLIIVRIYWSIF